ncbi:MAG: DegT/DnrJ/EryC1/StrS family aminotransferase [Oligoflexia bacterium]|nr:DegT/DnrJ/EryC1/StrS family aminotransferase [Oligoflexia bacterium]
MHIPITKPFLDAKEKDFIYQALESGWIVQGPFVKKFEDSFANFVGSKRAIATSNCTTALHLALEASGIMRGDKVIVPAFTFVASANSVEYTGAEVVFCDIDLKTFNIDMQHLVRIIEGDRQKKIKAIMPVNLFGLCADLPQIMEIAKQYNLKVIEDSACGLGGSISHKHSGTFGDFGCFSFHPRKSITTGEGGMLVTNHLEDAEKIVSMRDHGSSKSDLARHFEKGGSLLPEYNILGHNYRMNDLQGAMGVAQMEKLDPILNARRKLASNYNRALSECHFLTLPHVPQNYIHGYQSYVCLFSPLENLSMANMEKIESLNIKRNQFMRILEDFGIATRQGTHAVHNLGYYKKRYKTEKNDFMNSYIADRLSIALPLYTSMTSHEFNYVIEHIKQAFQKL